MASYGRLDLDSLISYGASQDAEEFETNLSYISSALVKILINTDEPSKTDQFAYSMTGTCNPTELGAKIVELLRFHTSFDSPQSTQSQLSSQGSPLVSADSLFSADEDAAEDEDPHPSSLPTPNSQDCCLKPSYSGLHDTAPVNFGVRLDDCFSQEEEDKEIVSKVQTPYSDLHLHDTGPLKVGVRLEECFSQDEEDEEIVFELKPPSFDNRHDIIPTNFGANSEECFSQVEEEQEVVFKVKSHGSDTTPAINFDTVVECFSQDEADDELFMSKSQVSMSSLYMKYEEKTNISSSYHSNEICFSQDEEGGGVESKISSAEIKQKEVVLAEEMFSQDEEEDLESKFTNNVKPSDFDCFSSQDEEDHSSVNQHRSIENVEYEKLSGSVVENSNEDCFSSDTDNEYCSLDESLIHEPPMKRTKLLPPTDIEESISS